MVTERSAAPSQKNDFTSLLSSLCGPSLASPDILLSSVLQYLSPNIGEGKETPFTTEDVKQSEQRWRTAFVVWRKVLDCDALFLALLLHSGCLWSVNYPSLFLIFQYRMQKMAEVLSEGEGEDGEEDAYPALEVHLFPLCVKVLQSMKEDYPFDMFTLVLLHFLSVVEVFSLPSSDNTPHSPPPHNPSLFFASSFSFSTSTSVLDPLPSTRKAAKALREETNEERFHTSEEFFFPACLEIASSVLSTYSSSSFGKNRPKHGLSFALPSTGSTVECPLAFSFQRPTYRRSYAAVHTSYPDGRWVSGGKGSCSSEDGARLPIPSPSSFSSSSGGGRRRSVRRKGNAMSSGACWWTTVVSSAASLEVEAVAHALVEEWFRLMDHPYLYGEGSRASASRSHTSGVLRRPDGLTTGTRTVEEAVRWDTKVEEGMHMGMKKSECLEVPSIPFTVSSPPSSKPEPPSTCLNNTGGIQERRRRDFWFACAIKFSSYVTPEEEENGNCSFIEKNIHIRRIVEWQKKEWATINPLLQKSYPAIFLCLLEQESCPAQEINSRMSLEQDAKRRAMRMRKEGAIKETSENEASKCKNERDGEEEKKNGSWRHTGEEEKRRESVASFQDAAQEGENGFWLVEEGASCTSNTKGVWTPLRLPPIPLLLPFHLCSKGSIIAVPRDILKSSHELLDAKSGVLQKKKEEQEEPLSCPLFSGEPLEEKSRDREGNDRTRTLHFHSNEERPTMKPMLSPTKMRKTVETWKNQLLSIPRRSLPSTTTTSTTLNSVPFSSSFTHPAVIQQMRETSPCRRPILIGEAKQYPSPAPHDSISPSSFLHRFLSSLLLLPTGDEIQEEERKHKAALAQKTFPQPWWDLNEITSHGFVVYHRVPAAEREFFDLQRVGTSKRKEEKDNIRSHGVASVSFSVSCSSPLFLSNAQKEGLGLRPDQGPLDSFVKGVEKKREESREEDEEHREEVEGCAGLGVQFRRGSSFLSTFSGAFSHFVNESELCSFPTSRRGVGATLSEHLLSPRETRREARVEIFKKGKEDEIPQEKESVTHVEGTSHMNYALPTKDIRCSLFQLGFFRIESGGRMRSSHCGIGCTNQKGCEKDEGEEQEEQWNPRQKGVYVCDPFLGRKGGWGASTEEISVPHRRKRRRSVTIKRSVSERQRIVNFCSAGEKEEENEIMDGERCRKGEMEEQDQETPSATPSHLVGEGLCPHVWWFAYASPLAGKSNCSSSPLSSYRMRGHALHSSFSERGVQAPSTMPHATRIEKEATPFSTRRLFSCTTPRRKRKKILLRTTPGHLRTSFSSSSLSPFGIRKRETAVFPSLGYSYYLLYDIPLRMPCGESTEDLSECSSTTVTWKGGKKKRERMGHWRTSVTSTSLRPHTPRALPSLVSPTARAVQWFQCTHPGDYASGRTSGGDHKNMPWTRHTSNSRGWVTQWDHEVRQTGISQKEKQREGCAGGRGKDRSEENSGEKQDQEQEELEWLSWDPLFRYLKALFCTARRALSMRGIALSSFSSAPPTALCGSSLASFTWGTFPTPEAELLALLHLSHCFALLALLLSSAAHFIPRVIGEAAMKSGKEGEQDIPTGFPRSVQLWMSEVTSFLADTSFLVSSSSSYNASTDVSLATSLFAATREDGAPTPHSFTGKASPPHCPATSLQRTGEKWERVLPVPSLLRSVCFALALHPVPSESVLIAVGWIARMTQLDIEALSRLRERIAARFREQYHTVCTFSLSSSPIAHRTLPSPHIPFCPPLFSFTALLNFMFHGRRHDPSTREANVDGVRHTPWLSVCLPQGWWILWYKSGKELMEVLQKWVKIPILYTPLRKTESLHFSFPLIPGNDLVEDEKTNNHRHYPNNECTASLHKTLDKEMERSERKRESVRIGVSGIIATPSPPVFSSSSLDVGRTNNDEDEENSACTNELPTEEEVQETKNEETSVGTHCFGEAKGPLWKRKKSSDEDFSSPPCSGESNGWVKCTVRCRMHPYYCHRETIEHAHPFLMPQKGTKTSFGVSSTLLVPHRMFPKEEEYEGGERRADGIFDADLQEGVGCHRVTSTGRAPSPTVHYYIYGDAVYHHTEVPPTFSVSLP